MRRRALGGAPLRRGRGSSTKQACVRCSSCHVRLGRPAFCQRTWVQGALYPAAGTAALMTPPTPVHVRVCAGCLQTSKIGAGNASAAVGGENNYDSRRTSSSMLVDPTVRRLHPEVAKVIDHIQQLGWELLEAGAGVGCALAVPGWLAYFLYPCMRTVTVWLGC